MKKTLEIVNIEAFQATWKKIQRRAFKLGLTVPVATPVGGKYFKEAKKIISSEYKADQTHKYAVEVQKFEVDEISYSFDGWTLVAVAEPIEGKKNLLVPISDKSEQWSQATFRHTTTGQVCEHCNTIRNRNKLFVIGRVDDHSISKQVGSSCLADFCDSNSSNVAAAFEFESLIYETLKEFNWEESESDSQFGVSILSPIEVLEVASEITMKTGYISRAKSLERDVMSTTEMVKLNFDSQCLQKNKIIPSEKAVVRAKTILDWAMETGPEKAKTDSYWNGVMNFMEIEMVSAKRLGYVVGLVGCYDAYLREKQQSSENSVSEFQGTIGDRVTFIATVIRVSNFESQWGTGTITILKTDDGHILKYWNYIGETGNVYQFSAGIKVHEHDQYMNCKITTLSRCTKIKLMVTV